jgi:hypothetical protein
VQLLLCKLLALKVRLVLSCLCHMFILSMYIFVFHSLFEASSCGVLFVWTRANTLASSCVLASYWLHNYLVLHGTCEVKNAVVICVHQLWMSAVIGYDSRTHLSLFVTSLTLVFGGMHECHWNWLSVVWLKICRTVISFHIIGHTHMSHFCFFVIRQFHSWIPASGLAEFICIWWNTAYC